MLIKKLQGQLEKNNGIYYEYDAESDPVGEGGMGVVYHGYRVDENTGLRTEVAIKALHIDLPEEVYARAEREASIQLRHDNLVEMLGLISIFESNKLGESIYHHYVVSEFLHGIELSDLLAGRFDKINDGDDRFARDLYNKYIKDKEGTSIYIIKNILSGVLALHDKGFIHRDIDPSNIMVTSDGHIKLIDFGIAKSLKALDSNDKLRTAAGQFIGKAEYASPELVLGDVRSQNYTTDIYALGILFYRLLVGRLPFAGSQYEVLQNQLKSKIPLGYIENKALAKVIRKATEKIQNHRYSSIAEFRVAIDVAERYKPGFLEKYGKFAIISILVLSIGSGLWYYMKPRPITIDKFEYTLNLLDSHEADSVKLGYEEMKTLADNGNDKAKIEIGITSFANKNNIIISQRRALLNKGNTSLSSEWDTTIKYLSSIKDESVITPEVYHILGGAYFYKGDTINALKNFEKALALLNLNNDAAHGYSNSILKENLEDNISVIKEDINE